jgi:hypothetical protein
VPFAWLSMNNVGQKALLKISTSKFHRMQTFC